MIYFDHNATTPLLPEARAAWLEASDRFIGNPSSPHRLGSRADAALNSAREEIAALLGCHPLDVVWTSGATESANIVFHHFSRALEAQRAVWISALEHPCVIEPARLCFAGRIRWIPSGKDGVIEADWLRGQFKKERPGVVAVMAANNETGVLQPWGAILNLCREQGVPFFCDATQWIGKLPAGGLGRSDYVAGSAHKFGGPRGVGFLKCPSQGKLRPLCCGGAQQEGRRAGTENVPAILSMVEALKVREKLIVDGAHCVRADWRAAFERKMISLLPGTRIVGAVASRLWNTVSAIMPESDCRRRWVVKLDKAGFAVSTGSACASGREEASHVLTAMGLGADEAGRVLRFSSGWETSANEWDRLALALQNVYSQEADPRQPDAN